MKVRIKKKPSQTATSLYDSGGYLLDNSMANLALYRAANKAAESLPYNSNTYDDGGSLYNTHGGVFTPGNLVFIDEGGTHEQNPYEGVLMGFDQTGTPNLVEEGEVVYNDYVFSNRLSPAKSDLKDFNLANKYHNKTFAKIAENVSKEAMERPNDPIYRKGLEDTLERLAQAQEAQRQRKMLSGTQNLMADGGRLYAGNTNTAQNNVGNTEYPTWLRYAPAVGSGIQYLQNVLGRPEFSSRDMLLEAAANLPRESVTFTPLNNRMRYMPLDRNLYLNPIRNQASATRRTIANSGQNAGMALANTIASDYNTNNAIGNALTQLADYNNKQRNSVAEFNRATDQYNSQGALSADTTNANLANQREQMRQAYILPAAQYNDQSISAWNDAKGKNFSNLMTNLGNIGRENFAFNQVNSNQALLYHVDENGVSRYALNPLHQEKPQEVQETQGTQGNAGAYGGRLKSKKRR